MCGLTRQAATLHKPHSSRELPYCTAFFRVIGRFRRNTQPVAKPGCQDRQ